MCSLLVNTPSKKTKVESSGQLTLLHNFSWLSWRLGGGDKCWAVTPPEYLTMFEAPPDPWTVTLPPLPVSKKHYIISLTKYASISLRPDARTHTVIYVFTLYLFFPASSQSPPASFFRSISLSAAKTKSALYTHHHNNHKCSDRFAATALGGVVHIRKK